METKSKLIKASMWCSILALVFAALPLVSAWFAVIMWMTWVLAVPAVICAVIAMVKEKNFVKAGIAIAITVLAIFLPRLLAEQYAKSAAKSAKNAVEFVKDNTPESAMPDYQF